jgi:uncharacterized lipoprotein YajG
MHGIRPKHVYKRLIQAKGFAMCEEHKVFLWVIVRTDEALMPQMSFFFDINTEHDHAEVWATGMARQLGFNVKSVSFEVTGSFKTENGLIVS